MSKELKIREEDLDDLLRFAGQSLVGKVMKRFEILSDPSDIKAETKELIYEETRKIKEMIVAYNMGGGVTTFQFKSKKPDRR